MEVGNERDSLHRRAPKPPGLRRFSPNPAFTLPTSKLLLVLFFYLRLLCPRLRIRETTKEPTPMQTHEGLFTSSSLGPSIPDTAEQGLGPRGGFQLSFMGWSRGPPEGVEEFLKFCLHSDMGLSRALSSVLILIGASCPWLGLCSHSNMGLSRTLSCKLFSSCN